MLTMKDQI